MSETANIAEFAKILSDEVFTIFGWQTVGPADHTWDCVEIEKHHKKKAKVHPSDVVFKYRDPYRGIDIYLNTDLKSYAKATLQSTDLASTLRSLSGAVECANKSPSWQAAYLTEKTNHDVVGLLFLYNHDGEFDKDFPVILGEIGTGQIKVERQHKVFVMGPDRIAYLNTIAKDILQERGAKRLPDTDYCHFYYPDMEFAKVTSSKQGAATVETLLGPWQILRFGRNGAPQSCPGYYFYSASTGDSEEEFMYIIDFIFTYQLLGDEDSICIRMPLASESASPHFERAKARYADEFRGLTDDSKKEFQARMSRITLRKITDTKPVFSKTEIGMKRHG